LNNSNRPKKLLYIGIILISFSILFFISDRFIVYYFGVLEGYIITLPPLVIGIILLRKYSRTSKLQEKLVSSKPQQPPKQQQDAGKTQFWVCPVCGNDTKEYHGRSYCNHCERYF